MQQIDSDPALRYLEGVFPGSVQQPPDIVGLSVFLNDHGAFGLAPFDVPAQVNGGLAVRAVRSEDGHRVHLETVGAGRVVLPLGDGSVRGTWLRLADGVQARAEIVREDGGPCTAVAPWQDRALLALRVRQRGDMHDLAHAAVFTTDLDAAIRYYTETLPFTLTYRKALDAPPINYALVELGTCVVELLEPQASMAEPPAPGLHHIAVHVDDIDMVVDRLRTAGVEFVHDAVGDIPGLFERGARGIFLRGPQGELIELFEVL